MDGWVGDCRNRWEAGLRNSRNKGDLRIGVSLLVSRRRLTSPSLTLLPSPFPFPSFLLSFPFSFLPLVSFYFVLSQRCSISQAHYTAQTFPLCFRHGGLLVGDCVASPENKTSRALGLPGLFSGHEGPGLLSQTLLWFLAPKRDGTQPLAPGASSQLFVDKPNFFDYPDSDQASLLAVAQFIGEKPVTFVKTGMNQLDRGASLLAGPGRKLLLTVWQVPALGSSNTSWWAHWWWLSSSCFSRSACMCESCLHVLALPLPRTQVSYVPLLI